ncbi:MAG: hypothetical protein GX444_19080 [Myxococcales bacterium]|nr:hypothetical protein [Myxococcales bacterium]
MKDQLPEPLATERRDARRRRNRLLAAFALFVAAWPLLTDVSPLQDQMDWVLQAKIIAAPAQAGWTGNYEVIWRPVPNILGTVLIAGLAKILPVFTAAAVVYAAYLLLWIAALVYFLRSGERDYPAAELLAPLYAANHFFLMGFFNFILGLALVFLAFGWLRRHGEKPLRHWPPFLLLATAVYLSHFLAFAILGLGCLIYAVLTYRRAGRRYGSLVVSFAPSLLGLAWYAQSRAGQFWFHYAFHNPLYYTWYQVGPWAIASSYYPLTPNWAVWINVAINAATILTVGGLVCYAAWKRRIDWRSPWAWTAAALLAIGLAAPTRIYELLRPGQRLIFAALLILPATILPARPFDPRRFRRLAAALGALLLWNAAWWFQAAAVDRQDLNVLERLIGRDSRMLVLADSHFHFRENRSYRAKLADPYAYPNSVNPHRYLPYCIVIRHGGYLRALFGTGIVRVRREAELLPEVTRLWHLDDPQAAGRYSHLVATGQRENLAAIADRAAPLFEQQYLGDRLLVMKRRPAPEPAPPAN